MPEVVDVKSLDEIVEALDNNPYVVVQFTTEWCQPCKRFYPHFVEFAKQHPEFVCLRVDVEKVDGVVSHYNLPPSVPQVYYFLDGEFAKDVKARTIIQLNKELG